MSEPRYEDYDLKAVLKATTTRIDDSIAELNGRKAALQDISDFIDANHIICKRLVVEDAESETPDEKK